MKILQGKNILIISPQSWGKMLVSKHHYAIELAKAGNSVFFLNPPQQNLSQKLVLELVPEIPNLTIVHHKLSFPYSLKFHALPLFHFFIGFHLRSVLKSIGKKIEVVWSFDLGNLYPFRLFKQGVIRIFHPVDEPLTTAAIASARNADIIFSVTKEILVKYSVYKVPAYFVNHGVSSNFIDSESNYVPTLNRIKVGFSGNLMRPDIDRENLLKIISNNPKIDFECWGAHSLAGSNIGGDFNIETSAFIDSLKSKPNVFLHGAISSAELPKAYEKMDAFLICYDIQKDQSKGTNYHKIMEFISTGKVVISNNVTTYKKMPQLVVMPAERDSNESLPEIFNNVISNLTLYNSNDLIRFRKAFAFQHSYTNNLIMIDKLLAKHFHLHSN